MRRLYKNLDDLWCEWGNATSAIMKHIELNETLESPGNWIFDEAQVISQHGGGYYVSITHSAYDQSEKSIVCLYVQAHVASDDTITVKTIARKLSVCE